MQSRPRPRRHRMHQPPLKHYVLFYHILYRFSSVAKMLVPSTGPLGKITLVQFDLVLPISSCMVWLSFSEFVQSLYRFHVH